MSVFREVLLFLGDVGVYDVVLPMLLIFAIVFAILDKTKIFGTETMISPSGKEKVVTRKNINAMVAFVAGFFVVASAQLVGVIHKMVADVSVVLIAFVLFMILIGVFHEDKELSLERGWKKGFMIIAGVALALIFFNALGWLLPAWEYLTYNWNSTFAATIILVGGMAVVIGALTKGPKDKEKEESDSD